MKVNFKCEKCGSFILEEVLTDVTKYSSITSIEIVDDIRGGKYATVCYGNSNDEDGELSHYQCASCGVAIKECYDEDELFDYLKENNMLEQQ